MRKIRFREASVVIVGLAILFFASGGNAGKKDLGGSGRRAAPADQNDQQDNNNQQQNNQQENDQQDNGQQQNAQQRPRNIAIEVDDGTDFIATVPVNLHNIHPLVRAVVLTASLQNYVERNGVMSGAAAGHRITIARSVVIPHDTDIVRDVTIGMDIPDTYTNADLPYYDVSMEFEVLEGGNTVYRSPIPSDDARAALPQNRHLAAHSGTPLYSTESGDAPQPR